MAPALPRLGCWCIQVPRGSHPRKSCPASAVARSSRPAPSPATHCVTQAVLGRIAKVLGSMEGTSHPGDTQNRCRLASCRFRLYWKWLSRAKSRGGRKPVSKQIRALIFQMVAENPTWGAPRIHGDLLKLGFDLSEPTVSRWVRRAPRPPDPARRWLIFLRNHREAIAAMDFFTVPTLTFGILYCFFVIGHDRRRILHCNVTRNPRALWVALQLHETWEYGQQPQRFLIFDRDAKYQVFERV